LGDRDRSFGKESRRWIEVRREECEDEAESESESEELYDFV
jgi:hypothetical protein